jgi:peptidoglycan/xylan/chitin deacetylase (PgdA/CDA1 family)
MAIWDFPSFMKEKLIKFAEYILAFIPYSLLKIINKRSLIGVFYHAISNDPMPHVDAIYPSLSSEQFEYDMNFLNSKYNFVSYNQINDGFEGKKSLPKNAIHLSFDDGFIECYTVVLPILEKLNIPCTFFITTDWIDNTKMFYRNKISILWIMFLSRNEDDKRIIIQKLENFQKQKFATEQSLRNLFFSLKENQTNEIEEIAKIIGFDESKYLEEKPLYLSTSQLKDMIARGFTIGAHTLSHPKLKNVDVSRMRKEISQSCTIIQEITGDDSVPFAFPNSATNIDRGELKSIYESHRQIGLLFNTKGILRDESFILNRIWAEKKLPNVKTKRRIPVLFKLAYIESTVENIRSLFRK